MTLLGLWGHWSFLIGTDIHDDVFCMILIWFDSHTCQISAFYIEFKGIKNPPKDWWHCWRQKGYWSLLTGAEVPDEVFDDFDMVSFYIDAEDWNNDKVV